MIVDVAPTLLAFATPLLAAVALMLFVPAAFAPSSRLTGAVTLFGALLLSAALVLVSHQGAAFTNVDSIVTTLMLLSAGLTIAPLADRARPASLMLLAPIAAYGMLSALFAFGVPATLLLGTSVTAASITALLGSALLPVHPSRYTVTGQLRGIATAQAISLIGWLLLAILFVAFAGMLGATPDVTMIALAGITAALVTLLTTRAEDGLAKAGESFAAAALLTCCVSLNIPYAVLFGLTAAFCVNRSEAIAASLRVDDPQHFIGALLLPAIAGLVLPGLLDTAQLGAELHWLGIALITGLALAALLWPLTMLLTGLALPKRRVAQGVRT